MVVFVEKKVIKFYDSLGSPGDSVLKDVLQYLSDEYRHRHGGSLGGTWCLSPCVRTEMPQQDNGVDCGVFACVAAEFLSRGGVLSFTASDMARCRSWISGCLSRSAVPAWDASSRTNDGSPSTTLLPCPIACCSAVFPLGVRGLSPCKHAPRRKLRELCRCQHLRVALRALRGWDVSTQPLFYDHHYSYFWWWWRRRPWRWCWWCWCC